MFVVHNLFVIDTCNCRWYRCQICHQKIRNISVVFLSKLENWITENVLKNFFIVSLNGHSKTHNRPSYSFKYCTVEHDHNIFYVKWNQIKRWISATLFLCVLVSENRILTAFLVEISEQNWVFVWVSTQSIPFYKMLFMNKLEFSWAADFLSGFLKPLWFSLKSASRRDCEYSMEQMTRVYC